MAGAPLPDDAAENHGTGNYARPPVAIIAGGGYSDEDFAQLREPSLGVSTIPWMRPDLNNQEIPFGDPKYPEHIANRAKQCLKALAEAGQLGDSIVYF